jgi:CRP-like cAMP-binding protein
MPSLDFLRRTMIFDGLPEESLSKVAECCSEIECKAGDRIFRDGEKAETMYIVMEGRVDLRFEVPGRPSSPEDTISSMRQGQPFGWSALVQSPIYSLSAYSATEKSRLLAVSRECLLALFDEEPKTGFVVMSNLAEVIRIRFHQLQEELGRRKGRTSGQSW